MLDKSHLIRANSSQSAPDTPVLNSKEEEIAKKKLAFEQSQQRRAQIEQINADIQV